MEEQEHFPIVPIILLALLFMFGGYLLIAFEAYQSVLNWIYVLNWSAVARLIRILGIALNFLLIAFIIFTLRRYTALQKSSPVIMQAPAQVISPKDEVKRSWEGIQNLGASQNPSDWNMAILRADALLDDTLQDLGYEGPMLSDRLRIVDPTKLPSRERVWSAHRLRNAIAHDPLEQHSRETIQAAIKTYEQAFKELQVLE
ncbi:MAG: Uncharacterized protein G01um101433_122 [Parcubacteria group bacterium Gr01-1014_33]|nr:MAG: Uncharacterized protein G01um101433_122 [Parcubacteria group bacterium Gr01-1014_33]